MLAQARNLQITATRPQRSRAIRAFASASPTKAMSQVRINKLRHPAHIHSARGADLTAPLAPPRHHQPVLAAGSAEPEAGKERKEPLFITTSTCPYAQRSWIALAAKGLKYTPVFVDL